MTTQPNLSNNELRSLAADVMRLSSMLTRERDTLPAAYLTDARLRKAYLAYFLPSNIPKIHTPLRELSLHPKNILLKDKLRVLDIGSGPGSALLGVMEYFSQQKRKPRLDLVAVDSVAENLKEADKQFITFRDKYSLAASLQTIQSGIEISSRLAQGPFDLIILSNVLNELFLHDDKRTEMRVAALRDLLGRLLAEDGSCIIIEPALRETSRGLLEVRDGMLEQGFHVYSPCPCNGKCPALADPRDWCHEDIPWERPALVKKLDKLTGLRKDSLKFSYLLLRKDGAALSDLCGPNAFRVVSEPLVSKGKREFYLCGAGERKLVTRLDKDADNRNHVFEIMKRGDVVVFDRLSDEENRYKVNKDTLVTLAW